MCLPSPHAYVRLKEAQCKELEPVMPSTLCSLDLSWAEPYLWFVVRALGFVA